MENAKRIDRLGDVFASGALKAIPNTTDRLSLMANALVSGSATDKPTYRAHWHSDRSIAKKIGRGRQSVNKAQSRLKEKGLIGRDGKKGCSQLTVIAEYRDLVTIAGQHEGEPTDIKPAPRPAGEDFRHLPDEVLESKILKSIPGAAGEVLLLITWLVQPDPQAHDFGQYSISAAEMGAVLHRDRRTIHRALADLTSAGLITREDNTITLQAHSADQLKKYQPAKSASARPFNAEAQARCQHAHQERGAVTTGNAEKERGAVTTPPGARSRHPQGRGHDTPRGAVTTQTTKEPLKRTISKNQEGHHPLQIFVDSGQVNGSQNGSHPDPEITAPPPPVTAHPARSHDRPGAGPDDLWDRVLHELELQLPETTFETWVRDTSIISHTEGNFIIGAPHAYARDWLRYHLENKVKTILNPLTQQTVEVSFEVRGKPQPAQAAEEAETPDPPDTFRQAKDAEIEYRQAQIENGNSHRRRRKPQRKTIHPLTPAQVPQPQQNRLAQG